MKRILLLAAAWLPVAAGLAVGRVYLGSRVAWSEAEARVREYNGSAPPPGTPADRASASRRADLLGDAVRLYRESALWWFPGNPYPTRALARLITIGQRNEQAGNDDAALYAYRAARSAILSVRVGEGHDPETLDQANRAIARISARRPHPPIPGEVAPSSAERERAHLALLVPPMDPSLAMTLLAAAGFLVWVAAALAFSLRGLDGRCRIRRRPAVTSAVAAIAGIAAWITGLWLA